MSDLDRATTKVRRTNADYQGIHMPSEHFESLGDYQDPDEAQDLEDSATNFNNGANQGYEDWEDLPLEEREGFRATVKVLYLFVVDAIKKDPNNAPPQQYVFDRKFQQVAGQGKGGKARKRGGGFPRKSQLLTAYRELLEEGALPHGPCPCLEDLLLKKRTKSHSGVLVISVIMGPGRFSCPKDCHYCPNQPGVARSYLLREPGVLRGYRNGWDPIRQFNDRARALENNGHIVDKIEIIILGGTFSFYPKDYAEEFIGALFYAANTYYKPGQRKPKSIAEEITENESTECRIIGLTVETRPDYITPTEIRRFRTYGVTRVQLGVQHLDDAILDKVNRECSAEQSKIGIKRLLDCGFKVDAHWMPDLPGSSFEHDMELFSYLLDEKRNKDYQVDQWKVYPTATVPFTKIKEWFDNGEYVPYGQKEKGRYMVELLCFILQNVPYRIRLNRVVRDIPSDYIVAGENRTNLRQEVENTMKKKGIRCRDVRERECKNQVLDVNQSALFVDEFEASGGTEYYISVEDSSRTHLFGHLRLRINADIHSNAIPELVECALIRELHTYGKLVAVNQTNTGKETQHVGVGKRLMARAEEIASSSRHKCRKIAVISGVGVRNYYRKLGYELEGTYMVKRNIGGAGDAGDSLLEKGTSMIRRIWQRTTSILSPFKKQ
eukprot:PhM_4_TR12042/c0_g1_i1/m.52728